MSEPSPAAGHCRLVVEILPEAGDWSAFEPVEPLVLAVVDAMASIVGSHPERAPPMATLVLGDDALVRRLNGIYRAKDQPTNVLSFPAMKLPQQPADPDGEPIGDVVLAVETIAREASSLAIPPRDHLAHLVAHGVLHLLGYDHQATIDAERMERLETEILGRLGIPDPYAGSEPELTRGAAEAPPKGR